MYVMLRGRERNFSLSYTTNYSHRQANKLLHATEAAKASCGNMNTRSNRLSCTVACVGGEVKGIDN